MSYVDPSTFGTPVPGGIIKSAWGDAVQTDVQGFHAMLGSVVYLADPQFGAHLDGATDDSTAFAAAMAATPAGGTLVLPAKPILLNSNIATSRGITFQGSGFYCNQDGVFGAAGWAPSNYNGSIGFGGTVVFLMGATSGAGLTLGPPSGQHYPCRIRDLLLVGPGTGTGTGLLGQNFTVADLGANIRVANFSNNIVINNIESFSAGSFKSSAAGNVGITFTNSGGNNSVCNGWGSRWSAGTGLSVSGSLALSLNAFELQANTGAVASIGGSETVLGPGSYCENTAATSGITIPAASTVMFVGLYLATASDTVTNNGSLTFVNVKDNTVSIINNSLLCIYGSTSAAPTGPGTTCFFFPGQPLNLTTADVSISAGKRYKLNGPADSTSAILRDVGTGDTVVGAGSGLVRVPSLSMTGATTTTTAPGAGGAGALPATPAGYVTVTINGTAQKIAYY